MRSFLLLFLGLYFSGLLSAQITGPQSPGSFTVVNIPGSSATWSNTGNVAASDNSYVTSGNIPGASGAYTDYLVVTDFGFSIPLGSTISGIVVEVERADPNARTADYSIRIVKNGVIGSTEKSFNAGYTMTDNYQIYGNAGDLWGEGWTESDINDAGFGVAIAAQRSVAGGTTAGRIDHIRIIVFYDFMTLPLRLISFTATKTNDAVLLKWTAAEETNMSHYEVQRSADGRNFTAINSIPSRNSLSNTSYSFTDQSPVQGVTYYRLKMIGHNPGDVKHSAVLTVHFAGKNNVLVWPSALRAGQALNVSNPVQERLILQFFDFGGKLLVTMTTSSGQLPSDQLMQHKGMIFYTVRREDGTAAGKGKLLVH